MKKNDKEQKENTPTTFTRRSLAKGFAAVGIGAFIPNIFQPTVAAACEHDGKWLREQPRKTPIVKEVDVLVVGGGAAGTAAALAAARMGAKTCVVELFGCLGGNGSAGMVSNYCGIATTGPGATPLQLVKGIGGDIINELTALEPTANTTWRGPSYNPETLKRALDHMAADANLDILYYTQFVEPIMEGKHVVGAIIREQGRTLGDSGQVRG